MSIYPNGYGERKKRGRAFCLPLQIALVFGIFLTILFLISTACLAWTAGGVQVSSSPNDETAQQIVSDGAGGAIITWENYYGATDADINAARINASGTKSWVISVTWNTRIGQNPQIAADGAGGAIITWEDNRNGNWNIYAQRLDANGAIQT